MTQHSRNRRRDQNSPAQRENIIYGFHSAEETIRSRPEKVNQIWIAAGQHGARLQQLLREARARQIPVKITERPFLQRVAGSQHHQDIVLEISPYKYFEAEDLLETITGSSLFCILDEIQDVANLAAIIRTAEGAGVEGIFLPNRRSASVTAATHRLSAGALEHIKIARVVNLAHLIDSMHQQDVRIICADSSAERLWYEPDYTGDAIAVLVGNEQKGVRRLLKEKSDDVVGIPMLGRMQSLNVTMATAILLYEVVRQRGGKRQVSP